MNFFFKLNKIVFFGILTLFFASYTNLAHSAIKGSLAALQHIAKQTPASRSSSEKTGLQKVGNLIDFPENTALPIRVQTGMRVDEIYKINAAERVFAARVILRLRWHDARLRFNTWEQGGDTLFFVDEEVQKKLQTIWQPMIKFANLDNGSSSYIEKGSGLAIHADGTVEYTQDFYGVFNVDFNLTAFPFDTQRLEVTLLSQKYNLSRVVLTTDQQDIDFSGLNQLVKLREWKFSAIQFKELVFRGWERSLHSQLNIEWKAKRDSITSITTIFMPLFLILFSNYLVIIYQGREDLEKNVTTIVSSLLAIIALDFTVSINYPALESNSMVNKTFMVAYLSSWILFIIAITVLNKNIARHLASRYSILELVIFLRWGMPSFLFVVIGHILVTSLL